MEGSIERIRGKLVLKSRAGIGRKRHNEVDVVLHLFIMIHYYYKISDLEYRSRVQDLGSRT